MTGYDEALDWFRADPERMQDLDDVDNRSAAIAIVNAVLAEAVPAGRDLTAQDELRRMSGWFGGAARKLLLDRADELDRIGAVVEGESPTPEPRGYRKGFDDGVKYARDIDRTIARMTAPAAPVDEAHRYAEGYDPHETGSLLVDIRAAWLAGHRAALAAAGAEPAPQPQEPPRFERGFYRTPDSKQEGPA